METETERDTCCVVGTWMQDSSITEGGGVWNIGWLVRCHNPLSMVRKRGTAAAASWYVIWPAGNYEPNIPTDLCRLSPPWIRFFRSTLTLMGKDAWNVFEPRMRDATLPDGNVWVRRRRRSRKRLLHSTILWGGGDRRMGDQPKEDGFGLQVLLPLQIRLWEVQGKFLQEGE